MEKGQNMTHRECVRVDILGEVQVHDPEYIEGKPADRVAQHYHNKHFYHLKIEVHTYVTLLEWNDVFVVYLSSSIHHVDLSRVLTIGHVPCGPPFFS